ncbi:hypothetical protein KAI87_08385 [Myxococcota bacterium]|nr:hypothetical protein [Myxococcota bacterium]
MNQSANDKHEAILQSLKTEKESRDNAGLLKLVAQGDADIKAGRSRTQEEVFEDLEKMLAGQ